jgi:hypothetical protein
MLAVASSQSAVAAQNDAVPPSTPIKTVRTPILEIGYHESGPTGGVPVIMLHGFPDDAHAYDGLAPILAGINGISTPKSAAPAWKGTARGCAS